MLSLALSLGFGQLFALGVHGVSWRLRHRALVVMAVLGVGGAAYIGLLVYVGSLISAYGIFTVSPPTQAQDRTFALTLGAGGLATLVVLAGVGFAHSLQLKREGWSRKLWLQATLALCAEIAAGSLLTLVWSVLSAIIFSLLGNWRNDVMALSYSVTLLALALFRPWFLKLWNIVRRTVRPA